MSAVAVASGLPSSNRGVSENERGEQLHLPVIVDYLAVSVDLFGLLDGCRWAVSKIDTINDLGDTGFYAKAIARLAVRYLFEDALCLADEVRKGRFYKWRVPLHDASGRYVGVIELGGSDTVRTDGTYTLRAELTGEGCRIFEAAGKAGCAYAERWALLADRLGAVSARISRVDLACDDYEGRYPIGWAREQYESGAFDKRGQRPKPKYIDDLNSGEGKTFYVGSRKSENILRIYEKGKEQGDTDSTWVRYEAELHGSNRRRIPFEVLIMCDEYLKGAYPALDFVSGVGERISSVTESVGSSAIRAVRHFRRQYGKLANLILKASEGCETTAFKLLQGCSRSGLPEWFKSSADSFSKFREAIPIH